MKENNVSPPRAGKRKLLSVVAGVLVISLCAAAGYHYMTNRNVTAGTATKTSAQPQKLQAENKTGTFTLEKFPSSPFAPMPTASAKNNVPKIPNGIFNAASNVPQVRGIVSTSRGLFASLSVGQETLTVQAGEKTKYGTVDSITKDGIYLSGAFIPLKAESAVLPPNMAGIPPIPAGTGAPVFALPPKEGGN